MAGKLVTAFLVCVVLAGALHASDAEAAAAADGGAFKSCFTACHDGCKAGGHGFTFCEVKCDTECTEKELADKLNLHL